MSDDGDYGGEGGYDDDDDDNCDYELDFATKNNGPDPHVEDIDLDFRSRPSLTLNQGWTDMIHHSVDHYRRSYQSKTGHLPSDGETFAYAQRQISNGITYTKTEDEWHPYRYQQAKEIQKYAPIPWGGAFVREDVLRASASRAEARYGIETRSTPAWREKLDDPPDPNPNPLWQGIRKVFGFADKRLQSAASLYDNNDMLTAKGQVVEHALSATPWEASSHMSDALYAGGEVGKAVTGVKHDFMNPVMPIWRYATAEDKALTSFVRQEELAGERARLMHAATAARRVRATSTRRQRARENKRKDEEARQAKVAATRVVQARQREANREKRVQNKAKASGAGSSSASKRR